MESEEIERLVHEALEQIGWDADAEQVAKRVKRLHYGLPREDEFSVICGWLGKCQLIHKLDQHQFPEQSKSHYQVPDLLAVFKYKEKDLPVLVEVKTSGKKNKLSFTPEYKEKLTNYAELLGLPMLIAWKNRWDVWSLVSLDEFKLAKKNYNLDFESALKSSLLGILAGDFAYTLAANSGVHISCKKEDLVSTVKSENVESQYWNVIIDDVYFTNRLSERIESLSPLAQKIFPSWDLDESEEVTDTHIIIHCVADETSMLFAHMALTRILKFESPVEETSVHWRSILATNNSLARLENFREGIMENLRKKIVYHVLEPQPQNLPSFLEKYNN
ncbi:MAG: hypothetical protein LAT63_05095 [Marinobacter sp.]|nr:hypothetical protein [Marinobacter sp.]